MRRWIAEASLSLVVLLWMHPFVFKLYAHKCERSTPSHERTASALRAVVISDVHLLGKRRRSWIERVWIDWQISSAVKAAVGVHLPDVVLVLGDQLDEGIERTELSTWQSYITRFFDALHSTKEITTMFLLGNHDVALGRYQTMSSIRRFEMAFGPSNRMLVVKQHRFIQLNTMALDSDVSLPDVRAESDSFLTSVVDARGPNSAQDSNGSTVLMTHLPLFRADDMSCGSLREPWGHVTYEHPSYRYAPHIDVLSKELSERLLSTLKPSVVLSGHTHAWCNFTHNTGTQEFTIPAFTWGQRPDPSYGVLDLQGGDTPTITLCRLPFEPYVFALYGVALSLIVARWMKWARAAFTRWRTTQPHPIHAGKKTP